MLPVAPSMVSPIATPEIQRSIHASPEFTSQPDARDDDNVDDTDRITESEAKSIEAVGAPFTFLCHQVEPDEVQSIGSADLATAKAQVDRHPDSPEADYEREEGCTELTPDTVGNEAGAKDHSSACLSPFFCFGKREASGVRSSASVVSLEQTSSSSFSSDEETAEDESSDEDDDSAVLDSKKYRLTITCEPPSWLR